MHAIPTHHAHQQPMRGWRHAVTHARARVSDLRLRTTMGALGSLGAPDDDRTGQRDGLVRDERRSAA